jgi:hypothetical protein
MVKGGRGSVTFTKASDGTVRVGISGPSGRINSGLRNALGNKLADKIEAAAKSGKPLNATAVKALMTVKGAKGIAKTAADTAAGFAQKGGAPKGTTMRLYLGQKAGELTPKINMRGLDNKMKFQASIDQLRALTKLKNLVPKGPKTPGTVIGNPLKDKSSAISIGGAKASAAAGGKFGQNMPKISDVKGNKSPEETAKNLMESLQSTAQREISKKISVLADKLGRDPSLTQEQYDAAVQKAESLRSNSKELKGRFTGNESETEKRVKLDQARAEAIAAVSANKDVEAAKQILELKKEYMTKGVMIMMVKNGTAVTDGKRVGPDENVDYRSRTGSGAKLPPNTHYGYFQSASVGKTGDAAGKLNISITDETRRLTGEKSDNRFTTTRGENIERMFVKDGNKWSEMTDKGLVPVDDVWAEIGVEKP